MALPTLGAHPRCLEEMRIGGGYNSTPDGGVDIDKQGNIAADGDLTIGGDLKVNGVDTTWSVFLSAREGWPAPSTGCASPVLISFGTSTDAAFYVMDFDKDSDEYAKYSVFLPPEYDGRSLAIRLYWTATSGTSGDVLWRIYGRCSGDGDDLTSSDTAYATGIDTFLGLNKMHVRQYTLSPSNAAAGGLLVITIRRQGSNGQDTFDADARLAGLCIGYL